MERAHVLAWPALRTANIEGWLWRHSGGGSQRANSVSTIDFTGNDPLSAIRTAEARYKDTPTRFQTFDETSPTDLPGILRAENYHPGEPTLTLFKRPAPVTTTEPVEIHDRATPEWRSLYLSVITPDRRQVNNEILDRIPRPSAFFVYRNDNAVVATALCVIGCGCAVIECVTTRATHRRQGAARTLLLALTQWAAFQAADWIGLQVDARNTPALTLYQDLGFVQGAQNTFWTKNPPGHG
jgi:GNAT superfamily N-acetyltransferase